MKDTMTETTTRDPRVVAAAHAIAATESRPGKVPTEVASAADYHEAIAVIRAIDELTFSAEGIARAEQAYKDLILDWGRGKANCDIPDVVRAVIAALKGAATGA